MRRIKSAFEFLKKIFPGWLGLALLYALFLSLPDAILYVQNGNIPPLRTYLLTAIFASCAPFIWHYFSGRIFLVTLVVISFSALIYRQYFGVFYSPPDVWALVVEFYDVILGLLDLPKPAVLTIVVLGLILASIFKIRPTFPKHPQLTPLLLIAAFVACLYPFVKILTTREHYVFRYFPDNRYSAFSAGFNSFFWAAERQIPAKFLRKERKENNVSKYSVIDRGTPKQTPSIIVLLGESINPSRMSIFGHTRETTPGLENLLKKYNGVATLALSSATATRVAIPMFINVVREPNNFSEYRTKDFNLFKLAKQRGYRTYFISTQEMIGFSSEVGLPYIDVWHDKLTNDGLDFDDEGTADFAARLMKEKSQPLFAIVNTRVAHAPYLNYIPEKYRNYSRQPGLDSLALRQAEYDDAIAYFDKVSTRTLENILSTIRGPVVVMLISDHGERLGENNGGFGHVVLSLDVAKIPFLYFSRDFSLKSGIDRGNPHTHYDIGRLIGKILGYELVNTNDDGSRYLNGGDLSGEAGSIKYQPDSIDFKYDKPNHRQDRTGTRDAR